MLRVAVQTGWTTIHEGIANIIRTPFLEDCEANFLVEPSAAFRADEDGETVQPRLCHCAHHDNLALDLEKSTTWF